jgi:methylated-DNA-[protein]-cysteine S-methyltransferase
VDDAIEGDTDMNTATPVSHARMDSPVGALHLRATADAIVGIGFHPEDPMAPHAGGARAQRWLDAARRQLDEYFAGERARFELPLSAAGSPFQRAVWGALVTLPFGDTLSYVALAHRLGRPTAARAVGAANGRNPIAIVVPCHRVIGSDGSLTGYAGGLPRKRWLLAHEGVAARHPSAPNP